MQVSNAADAVVSSIASANDAEAFTFANTPEAFSVFFASLYKDPLYAFVREAICNAWDAHIVANTTDTPIQITLGDGYLIVADSGTGIPLDKMQATYCTIGASTKKRDGRQTGGFGYGCKSPFAYTDNFEVTSHIGGVKGIFRLLRADPNKEGFPSCTPIVNIPTTHTGLTVKVPLPSDVVSRVHSIIREVAYLGSIKVCLNEELLPVMSLGTKANDHIVLPPARVPHILNKSKGIFVRYGNVVYPITEHEAYMDSFSTLRTFLGSIFGTLAHPALILQAAPDSLAITPSREELSQQDLTLNTISQLLDNFIENVPTEVAEVLSKTIDDIMEESLKDTSCYEQLVGSFRHIHLLPEMQKKLELLSQGVVTEATPEMLAYNSISNASVMYKQYVPKIVQKRMNWVLENTPKANLHLTRMMVSKINQMVQGHASFRNTRPTIDIPYMEVFKSFHVKALMAATQHPELQKKELLVWNSAEPIRDSRNFSEKMPPLHPVKVHGEKPITAPFGAFTRKVAISYTKTNIMTRLQKRMGEEIEGMLVYVLPSRKKAVRELAINAFEDAGYVIEDLTQYIASESHFERQAKKVEVSRAQGAANKVLLTAPAICPKQGVLSLKNIVTEEGNLNIRQYRNHKEPVYIQNPEVVLHIPLNKDTANTILHHPEGVLYSKELRSLVNAYGDRIGIVTLKTHFNKHKTDLTLSQFLARELSEYVKQCPRVVQEHKQSLLPARIGQVTEYSLRAKLEALFFSTSAQKCLGLTQYPDVPALDIDKHTLLSECEFPEVSKVLNARIAKLKLPAKDERIVKKLVHSLPLEYLTRSGVDQMCDDLSSTNPDVQMAAKAVLRTITKHTFEENHEKD